MEPTKKRKYHYPADLKQDLLQKGIEIIQSQGIEGLTLKSLAGSLGVTSAAMYHHYSHKTALFIAIVEKHLIDLKTILDEQVYTKYSSNKDLMFIKGALCFFTFCAERPDFLLLVSSDGIKSWNEIETVQEQLNYCFSPLLNAIAEGQQQKIFKEGRSEVLLSLFFGPVYGFTSLIFNNRLGFVKTVDSEVRNGYFNLVLASLWVLKTGNTPSGEGVEEARKDFVA